MRHKRQNFSLRIKFETGPQLSDISNRLASNYVLLFPQPSSNRLVQIFGYLTVLFLRHLRGVPRYRWITSADQLVITFDCSAEIQTPLFLL